MILNIYNRCVECIWLTQIWQTLTCAQSLRNNNPNSVYLCLCYWYHVQHCFIYTCILCGNYGDKNWCIHSTILIDFSLWLLCWNSLHSFNLLPLNINMLKSLCNCWEFYGHTSFLLHIFGLSYRTKECGWVSLWEVSLYGSLQLSHKTGIIHQWI